MVLKIKKPDYLIILLYLIFVKPGITEDIPILDILWNMGRFSLTLLFIFRLFFKRNGLKAIWIPLLIFLTVLCSTILHHGLIYIVLGHWVPTLGLIAYMELNKTRLKNIVQTFYNTGGFLIIVNLITVLAYPNGMWIRGYDTRVWLLGQKQDFITCIFSTVFFGLLCYHFNKKQTRFFYLIVGCIAVTLFIVKPIGLILCLFTIAGLLLIEKLFGKIVDIKLLFAGDVAAHLLAIFIAFGYENMTSLRLFLAGVANTGMDKSQTLGLRFRMWVYVLNVLKNNPFLGLGQVNQEMWYQTSSLNYYHTIVHNLPLDIALTGGGIALSLYIIWNITAVRRLNRAWSYPTARYIGIVFFAFNIICITECPYQPMTMIVYAFALWVDRLLPFQSKVVYRSANS